MITPEFLNEIIKGTEKNVSELQDYLITDICKHIIDTFKNNPDKTFMPSTINQMHQLMDSGMVADDIQKQIEKRLPSLKKEIRKAFLLSAQEISDHNTEIAKEIVDTLDNQGNHVQIEIPEFEKVGLPKETSQLNMTPTEVRKLEQVYKSTNKTVVNFTKTLPSACETRYIELCDNAFMKVQNGVPIDKAIVEAIHDASKDGLHIVNYDSGHRDTIEVAIARAVRSGINKANAEIVLTRCGEMGINYVKVSEHLGARVTKYNDYTNHSLWQGKVYKLDWNKSVLKGFKPNEDDYKGFKWLKDIKNLIQKFKDRKYPDFVDVCGYGQLLGICGVNCRHTFSAFYPEVQEKPKQYVDPVQNKIRYEQEQKLRAMERNLRKKKTELQALNYINFKSVEADKRKGILQSQIKQLEKDINAYSRQNRIASSNWRKEISKYVDIVPHNEKKIGEYPLHTEKEFREMIDSSKKYLDTVMIRKSKWSGKINIVKHELEKSKCGKEWNCSITFTDNAQFDDAMHECIHSYSTSYGTDEEYLSIRNVEEGAVQFLNQEICKKYNIPITTHSYTTFVNAYKDLNKIIKLYDNDLDFAIKLNNILLSKKIGWLNSKIMLQCKRGIINENEVEMARQCIDSLFKEF